jgi:tRNA(adenine34) deaminase
VGDIVRHPKLNHRAEVTGGLLAEECGEMLRKFFQERRGVPPL